MTVRQVSISEFKAHCTDEIRAVERGDVVLELTRHGKIVAVVQPPTTVTSALTLEDWVGRGKGTVTIGPGYNPSGPAFSPAVWES